MSTHAVHSARWQRTAGWQCALLIAGIGAATLLRTAMGGPDPAASQPAALIFAAVLLTLAGATGWRPGRWRWFDVALGTVGAGLLLAAWLTGGARLSFGAGQHVQALLMWTPVVTTVAVTEEVLLRGVLFAALMRWRGVATALVVTSVVFALIHVPLYGWQVVPLDCAVGFLLGGLRVLTGGVTAPAVAHALTDLATGWLG